MTLDEKLRIYDITHGQAHHHKCPEGLSALQQMKDEIVDQYCVGDYGLFQIHYKEYRLKQSRGYE